MWRFLNGLWPVFSVLLGLLAAIAFAHAQGVTRLCVQSEGATTGENNCVDASSSYPLPVAPSGYPYLSTPITGNGTGTTGAVVGTLAGVAGKTTWICGFSVGAIGTGAIGPITIAGTITSSMIYQLTAAAGGASVVQTFGPECIPASAANTPITITTTADGSASAVDVNSWGFQQ